MNVSKFTLGFGFILIGLAIASGLNYLDMRQMQGWVDEFVSTSSPSHVSGVRHSLETKDEFSKKYITPELSVILLRDYSTIDADNKSNLQEILHSVSQKKSEALKSMGTFGLLACLSFMNYSIIRKSQNRKSGLAGVPA